MSKRKENLDVENLKNDRLRAKKSKQPDEMELETLFNKAKFSDVKIRINGRVFRAHKVILLRNSEFKKLFEAKPGLIEIYLSTTTSSLTDFNDEGLASNDLDNNPKHKLLQIPTYACETFLHYLYDPTILNDYNTNLDLILVAHKFGDEKLKKLCENYLDVLVSIDDVSRTLLVAMETDCEKLKKTARDKIALCFLYVNFDENFQVVLKDDGALAEILSTFDEWQIILLTEKEDESLENKLESLRSVDLILTVEQHRFLVHKDVLCERNAELEKIIDPVWEDFAPTEIDIGDVNHATFKIFLEHIYKGHLEMSSVSKNLLKLALRYKDQQLKDFCEGVLQLP